MFAEQRNRSARMRHLARRWCYQVSQDVIKSNFLARQNTRHCLHIIHSVEREKADERFCLETQRCLSPRQDATSMLRFRSRHLSFLISLSLSLEERGSIRNTKRRLQRHVVSKFGPNSVLLVGLRLKCTPHIISLMFH
jgi:hypothetical protein